MFTNDVDEFVPIKYWRQQDRDILVFEDYLVNIEGKIYSVKSEKYLKPFANPNRGNYLQVGICNDTIKKEFIYKKGYKKNFYVHKIVACTFIDNIDRMFYTHVHHIDGNPQHNHRNNLEWVTAAENSLYRFNDINKNQLYLFNNEKE